MTLPSGTGQTTKARSLSVALASDEVVPIWTGDHSSDSFSLGDSPYGLWLDSGSDIATDGNPNTTGGPSSARICHVAARPGTILAPGLGSFRLFVVDGTSLAAVPWLYDPVKGLWVQMTAAVTVTAANGLGTLASNIGGLVGAQLFAQITTNTGNVKKAAYGFF